MTSRNPKRRWSSGYNGKMGDAIKQFPFDLCWKKYIEFQTPNKEQALELESELMKWYDSVENGYNSSEYGSGNYERTDETKKKISESKIGEKNPNFGKHFSEEHKKKLSEALSGHEVSEETRKKISENIPSKQVLQFSKNGEFIAEYPSIKEASRQTGCYQQHICKCCKGKRKSAGGFIWKYKEI